VLHDSLIAGSTPSAFVNDSNSHGVQFFGVGINRGWNKNSPRGSD